MYASPGSATRDSIRSSLANARPYASTDRQSSAPRSRWQCAAAAILFPDQPAALRPPKTPVRDDLDDAPHETTPLPFQNHDTRPIAPASRTPVRQCQECPNETSRPQQRPATTTRRGLTVNPSPFGIDWPRHDAPVTSDRLADRARRDFSAREASTVLELLSGLEGGEDQVLASERVQGAVLLLAAGDSRRFVSALALAQLDWRDVLVAARFANADWPQRLDAWVTDGESCARDCETTVCPLT